LSAGYSAVAARHAVRALLRELVSGPDVPPSVRFRACAAVLRTADTSNVEEIVSTSPEGVQAKRQHNRFIEALGG
jgi:hypothetical protein